VNAWAQRLWAGIMSPPGTRVLNGFVALGTGVVLGLAAWLTPALDGHGTHTQLGLGECTFLQITDYPCPMCGATTTFTLMTHLHPIQGFINQPFAAMLWMITVATFAISLVELVQPKKRWDRIFGALAPYEGPLSTGFLAVMGLAWIYKIAIMKWAI
jgi:hypothetical protein